MRILGRRIITRERAQERERNYTTAEVAEMLGITVNGVWARINRGKLDAYQIRKRREWRIPSAEVRRLGLID